MAGYSRLKRPLKPLLIAALMLIFPTFTHAGELYLEAAIGVHDERGDAPEMNGMDNPIGSITFGYEWRHGRVTHGPALSHDSSLPSREQGHGYNRLYYKVRIKLN